MSLKNWISILNQNFKYNRNFAKFVNSILSNILKDKVPKFFIGNFIRKRNENFQTNFSEKMKIYIYIFH